ncbi:aminomethyl-transferring glycine dehydrogenase subunit GcvPA [Candidatus Sumerlaeota bacterium]|nr:aminomethyl-transferring glycine dehydrogenase subunit GcvPA [Candidatus Sumerlaeota bacterium]
MNPYLCTTDDERKKLMDEIGVSSIRELFQGIPAHLQLEKPLEMDAPEGEYELANKIRGLAANAPSPDSFISFMGGGIYEHFIPSLVHHLAERSEFVTSYTPYQPEASQGNLQVFFEYQSLICRLFEMDVSNASHYDGATALAEAVIMAKGIRENRRRILIPETLHPFYRELLLAYIRHLNLEPVILKSQDGIIPPDAIQKSVNDNVLCVILQNPNFFGCIEEMNQASEIAHTSGALFISVVDPISLGLLAPPGEYDADIAVAEGQSLGLPPYFGGETLGIFTCKKEFMRKAPGRLVGMTKDARGRRGFVLTLQTREQHIRREKATSNICTNHALNATRAAVFLSTLGPRGIEEMAENCHSNAEYAKGLIQSMNDFRIAFTAPTFKEFVVRAVNGNNREWMNKLMKKGLYAGPSLERFHKDWKDLFLVCATELRTKAEIDALVQAMKE